MDGWMDDLLVTTEYCLYFGRCYLSSTVAEALLETLPLQ